MKNIIKISFLALAAAFLSTSCLDVHKYDGNDPMTADDAQFATIIDGGYEVPYYVIFDNDKKAYVTENIAAQSITFPSSGPMKGEVRKFIYFNYEDDKREGYDFCIRIVGMENISTSLLKDVSDKDIAEQIKTHTAAISIQKSAFSKLYNYITLEMHIKQSSQEQFIHSIILAHNKGRQGVFSNIYNSTTDVDSYLWLELYHDSDYDAEEYTNPIHTTYKIDAESLGIENINKYKGIFK